MDFPEFTEPSMIDTEHSWTAAFASYNQRTDDIYYVVSYHTGAGSAGGGATVVFMAEVWIYSPSDWEDPDFDKILRAKIHEVAATGVTNTTYRGRLGDV